MTTWDEIRDEIAGMLADRKPLEDVITKLEQRKNEMAMTNEEWFCQLSTKEKATFLASNKMLNFDYQMWIEWLKEKHK